MARGIKVSPYMFIAGLTYHQQMFIDISMNELYNLMIVIIGMFNELTIRIRQAHGSHQSTRMMIINFHFILGRSQLIGDPSVPMTNKNKGKLNCFDLLQSPDA